MKKFIFYVFIAISMIFMSLTVSASETLKLVVDTVPVTYTDAYPFIQNGRTMIPLRILSESMQAEVDYNEKTRTITIKRDGNCTTRATYGADKWSYIEYKGKKYENSVAVAVFTADSAEVTVKLLQGNKTIHSTKTKMDVAAKIINGRTYIPARYVAYALGYGIYYDQPRNRILYQYKANQIADFESKRKYNHDYYSYNSLIMGSVEALTNYRSWAYRDGYADIKVVDGDNGWELYKADSYTERSHEMGYLTYMPVNYTFETTEYVLSPKNKPEENFGILKQMLESKTTGTVTKNEDGEYSLNIDTYDELVAASYKKGKYIVGPQRDIDIVANSLSGSPFAGAPRYGRYDYTMFYYTLNGQKLFYDGFRSGTAEHVASRYNLLFLETFLGETGERIWKMMDDYYMHKGAFYIEEKCTGEGFEGSLGFLDVEINKEHAAKYGFELISSVNEIETSESYKIATFKYNDFEFSVDYTRKGLRQPQVGYLVIFENIPQK